MGILTLKEAIAQKSTPSELRVLANSLDRIAKDGYVYETNEDDLVGITTVREPAYDRKVLIENAASLRRLAGQLQRIHAPATKMIKEVIANA